MTQFMMTDDVPEGAKDIVLGLAAAIEGMVTAEIARIGVADTPIARVFILKKILVMLKEDTDDSSDSLTLVIAEDMVRLMIIGEMQQELDNEFK
jgi:hypothetical protein